MLCGTGFFDSNQSAGLFGGGNTSSNSDVFIPNLEVTVNNGFLPRNCIITLSAEASIDNAVDAEGLQIGYAFDSDDPSDCQGIGVGPTVFIVGESIQQARTIVGVKKLGPGFHTIRPCFAVFNTSDPGDIVFPCLVVECRTQ